MNTRITITALSLSALTVGLVACSNDSPLQTASMQKTVQIMQEDKSQVALLLNKDLSITVAGVEAGLRARPCMMEPNKKNSADGNSNPASSSESCSAAANPKGEIFYQKAFTVSIVRGSCCVRISSGDQTYELCSGPNIPVEFINQITGQTCPSG